MPKEAEGGIRLSMTFSETVAAFAREHRPCIVLAVRLDGDHVSATTTANGLAGTALSAEKYIDLLAALRSAHDGLIDQVAKVLGAPESELRNAVAERVNQSRIKRGPESGGLPKPP